MNLYPAIDLLDGRCVRLKQGDYEQQTIFSDDPVMVAQEWVRQGAERLHLVDLNGARERKPYHLELVKKITQQVNVPCQLGGGIRNQAHLEAALAAGVAWVVLGTSAWAEPEWVKSAATQFPKQIVVGVDARQGRVATEGWLETSQTLATDLIQQMQDVPLYASVYTDIATDGMMMGPNIAALTEFQKASPVPVIASGGICELHHLNQLQQVGLFGCIVGRALYEGKLQLPDVLNQIRQGPSHQATPLTRTT